MSKAGGSRICPFCKEEVGQEVAKCPYCAEDLPQAAAPDPRLAAAPDPRLAAAPDPSVAAAAGASRVSVVAGKRGLNLTAVVIVGVVVCGLLVGVYLWLAHNRFYILSGREGIAYEVDRRTGETWTLRGANKTRHKSPELDRRRAETIPPWEAAKITGNAGLSGYGSFSGMIYNGSGWTVTRVIFTVTAKEESGAVRWTRDLAENCEVAPMTTGSFSVSVPGDQGVKDVVWLIKEASGRKE